MKTRLLLVEDDNNVSNEIIHYFKNDKDAVVLASFENDYEAIKFIHNDINYIVQKPLNINDIKDLILSFHTSKNDKRIKIRVTEILTNLGMSANIEGFEYTRSAIIYAYNNRNTKMDDIYKQLSIKYKVSKFKIERDIRHAIFVSWVKADEELSYKIFGNIVSRDKPNPTNSEYIYTIVDKLKIGMI